VEEQLLVPLAREHHLQELQAHFATHLVHVEYFVLVVEDIAPTLG